MGEIARPSHANLFVYLTLTQQHPVSKLGPFKYHKDD